MKITWFGHAAFRVEIAGAVILIDPFLSGSPVFPKDLSVEEASAGVTHILLTHGHDDHIGDAIDIAKKTGAQITGNAEICGWAGKKGIKNLNPMNSGGKIDVGPFSVAMTIAHHSSSRHTSEEGNIYLGNPHGLVISAPGEKPLYHMGDTCAFTDMQLINELHAPKIGIVPIGDRYTMGGKEASLACKRFFDFDTIIPCHFGTFPGLDPDAGKFKAKLGADASKVKDATIGEAFTI
ncbi:metal-dependent hydrolase [Breoghania sp.]|uniref:metal-dependent hydrolase n=1 Tax=Breoghania sp. TaxID=2065378 RepID=UPI002AA6A3D8|nr:metal-dependent hydrolase [Breoghania sp.]